MARVPPPRVLEVLHLAAVTALEPLGKVVQLGKFLGRRDTALIKSKSPCAVANPRRLNRWQKSVAHLI